MGKLLLFHPDIHFAFTSFGKCVSKGRVTKRCKKFNCENIEMAAFMKSGSMPLR